MGAAVTEYKDLVTAAFDLPLCPSRVWFIERLLGAARPLSLASSVDKAEKQIEFRKSRPVRKLLEQ